jgi:hypothetical protein
MTRRRPGPDLLYASTQDAKFDRAAVEWSARFIEECSPSLLRARGSPWRPCRSFKEASDVAEMWLCELARP